MEGFEREGFKQPKRKAYGSVTKQAATSKTPGGSARAPPTRNLFELLDSSASDVERSPSPPPTSSRKVVRGRGKKPKEHQPEYPMLPLANSTPFQTVRAITNVRKLNMKGAKKIWRYDLTVHIGLKQDEGRKDGEGTHKIVALTGQDREATKQRRTFMNALVHEVLKTHWTNEEGEEVLSADGALVYDGNSTIFTNEEMSLPTSMEVAVGDLSEDAKAIILSQKAEYVTVKTKPCTESSAGFTISEALDLIEQGQTDRPLRQFLELLTTQQSVNDGSFLVMGGGKFCSKENFATPNFFYERRSALIKGASTVGTEFGVGAQLTADVRTMTTYPDWELTAIAQHLCNWNRIPQAKWRDDDLDKVSNFVRGKQVTLIGGKQTFEAYRLVAQPLRLCCDTYLDTKTKQEIAKEASITKFAGKLKLSHPDWPSLEQRTPYKVHYFPLEALKLTADQPVAMAVLKSQDIQPVAVPPSDRFHRIDEELKNMGLIDKDSLFKKDENVLSSILARFSVELEAKPIETLGFRRPAPRIAYNGALRDLDRKHGSWRTSGTKFTQPAKIEMLLFAYNNCDRHYVREFAHALLEAAEQKGMSIDDYDVSTLPLHLESEFYEESSFFETIKEQHPLNTVVIYVDPLADKTHGDLKLLEQRYEVLTQHVTIQKARSAIRNTATMENILFKLNCKCGGYNYSVNPETVGKSALDRNVLIIGVDVAHPTGQSAGDRSLGIAPEFPSVVGWSANCLRDPNMFVGDFGYQEPRQEKIADSLIYGNMIWTLKTLRSTRGVLPKTVYIFRDGISEGQRDMALRDELPAFKRALADSDPNTNTEFVLVVATKRHHKRFFTQRDIQNPLPLSVFDKDITSRKVTEFFLQSHQPLQGTAKSTAYQVLYSDKRNLTQDLLQALILALCFGHQVSANPISIPEPVYQADEWAKRGNELFRTYKNYFHVKKVDGSMDENSRIPTDWAAMTEELCYKNTALGNTRVNA